MRVFAEETVKWAALGKEALVALIGGVGIVAAAGLMIIGTSHGSDARREGRGAAALPRYSLAALGLVVCIAALVIGFIAMTHKSG